MGIAFQLIYGTQTGQSKAISESIAEEAEVNGWDVKVYPMSETVTQIPWIDFPCLIFITSSTGDGEPPENAMKFYKTLKNPDLPFTYLSHVKFTLLGLGDSNYNTFGGFPQALEKRLLELGASKFYDCALADDAVGLEVVVEPWKEGLWSAMEVLQESPGATKPPFKEQVDGVSPQASQDILLADQVPKEKEKQLAVQIELSEEAELKERGAEVTSLTRTGSALSSMEIRVPALPLSFISCSFDPSSEIDCSALPIQNGAPLPLAAGPVHFLPLSQVRVLTRSDAEKKAIEVVLNLKGTEIRYEPGDSLAVLCPNPKDEVIKLLERLELGDKADVPLTLSLAPQTNGKKQANLPVFLSQRATLRHIFTHCIDIRSPPRKPSIRVLAEYTVGKADQRRLKELCSVEGSDDYLRYVRVPHLSLLDLLLAFPSCRPPIHVILEQSSRLLPRPYSYCSSQLAQPDQACFIFKVVHFDAQNERQCDRKGVATGYMEDALGASDCNLATGLAKLSLHDNPSQLACYQRLSSTFHLPEDPSLPIILVGPGSGVAPFLGFAQHREAQLRANPHMVLGPIWLFFGCRHRDRDFLYREELERLHNVGILSHFLVCFSKSPDKSGEPVYVQDLIAREQHSIVRLLLDKDAVFYVCGDATNMAKDVMSSIVKAIAAVRGVDLEEAKRVVLDLQTQKRYLQDIWV